MINQSRRCVSHMPSLSLDGDVTDGGFTQTIKKTEDHNFNQLRKKKEKDNHNFLQRVEFISRVSCLPSCPVTFCLHHRKDLRN